MQEVGFNHSNIFRLGLSHSKTNKTIARLGLSRLYAYAVRWFKAQQSLKFYGSRASNKFRDAIDEVTIGWKYSSK